MEILIQTCCILMHIRCIPGILCIRIRAFCPDNLIQMPNAEHLIVKTNTIHASIHPMLMG